MFVRHHVEQRDDLLGIRHQLLVQYRVVRVQMLAVEIELVVLSLQALPKFLIVIATSSRAGNSKFSMNRRNRRWSSCTSTLVPHTRVCVVSPVLPAAMSSGSTTECGIEGAGKAR